MSALSITRDHARTMADRPSTSYAEAQVWTQIADEIDAYLGDDTDQGDLFAGEVGGRG